MPRTNISKDIISSVKSAYGQKIRVFDTQIPHSVRAVEATAEGKSILPMTKAVRLPLAYEQFAKEVVEIGEKQRKQIELTAYDDLFETDESRAEAALSKIREIPISEN